MIAAHRPRRRAVDVLEEEQRTEVYERPATGRRRPLQVHDADDLVGRHLSALDRIVAAYNKRSRSGAVSTVTLRASAAQEFAEMRREVNERTVGGVLTLQLDLP